MSALVVVFLEIQNLDFPQKKETEKRDTLPCKTLYEIIICSTDVAKIVMELPKKYNTPPNTPTDRIENFLNSELENKPAKLTALKKQPLITVTADVPPPQLVINSLKIKPNDDRLPNIQA